MSWMKIKSAIVKQCSVVAVERVHTLHQHHIVGLLDLMFYVKDHEEKQSWMPASTESRFNAVF